METGLSFTMGAFKYADWPYSSPNERGSCTGYDSCKQISLKFNMPASNYMLGVLLQDLFIKNSLVLVKIYHHILLNLLWA